MTSSTTKAQRTEPAESVTIITGAGSGLGRALSASLAGQGRPVVLVGRREDRLLETRAICVAAGGSTDRCLVVVADVTRRDAAEEVVSRTLLAFGTIAALVNNAGLASFASNERAELDDWYRMFHTNTLAPAAFIKHATPALRKARGVVINIGSIGGLLALPQRAMYGASKAALAHLTRSLARELAPEIRVNAVLPGAIDTDMYDTLGLRESETLELRAEMIRTTPLERMGTVEDVVPWIEVLLGPAGRWVTGSLVVVDGGRSC